MINWKKLNKYLPWWDRRILSEDPLIADLFKMLVVGGTVFGILLWLTASVGLELVKPFDLRKPIDEQVSELDSLLTRIVKSLQGEIMLGDMKMQSITFKEITEPSTPATNQAILFVDSSDSTLKIKYDDGDLEVIASY